MILFTSLKTLQFLLIASRIILPMLILMILKIECLLPEKRLMIAMMRSPMIPRTHLIHPFLMFLILALLMAMMPLWMLLTKELAIVPYVKHEIVAIAPTLDCPIILL